MLNFLMKYVKKIFPAYKYDNHTYKKKMSHLYLIMLLLMVLMYWVETSYSYRGRAEEWIAEPILYVIFLFANLSFILIECFSYSIYVIIFDGIFFKSGLTSTEITRVFLPSSIIFTYLHFVNNILPANKVWIYILIIYIWFYINYFILMRRIMKYSVAQSIIVISFCMVLMIIGVLISNL